MGARNRLNQGPGSASRPGPLQHEKENVMNVKSIAARAVFASLLITPFAGAQTYYQHRAAVRAQERSDAHHHTKAKVVGGSAVGGAVVGGLMGGGKGALIGAGVGAGGGLLANKVRKDKDVRRREETGRY